MVNLSSHLKHRYMKEINTGIQVGVLLTSRIYGKASDFVARDLCCKMDSHQDICRLGLTICFP